MSSHPENAVNVYVKKHSSRQNGKRPSLRAQIGWMSRVYLASVLCMVLFSYSSRRVVRWVLYGLSSIGA